MTRIYGKVTLANRTWLIETEPHIVTRLKRVFEKIGKFEHKVISLSDTLENCRELHWFLQRYPMDVVPLDYLECRSQEYIEHNNNIANVINGQCQTRNFELAIPPRDYQKVAAEVVLQKGSLLLADALGTGKTVSAILMITDARTRPALVVTLTHLPSQWERELHRFAPGLKTHVLKSAQPYDLTIEKVGRRSRKVDFPTTS